MDAGVDAGQDAGMDAGDANVVPDGNKPMDARVPQDATRPTDADDDEMDGDVDAGSDAGVDASTGWVPATVARLASGLSHSCLVADGRLLCWGDNEFGKVGNGTTTLVSSPTGIDATHQWQDVCTGEHHTCALESGEGKAFCWGQNTYGQLGVGDTMDRTTPTEVVSGVVRFVQIACQGDFTCALDTNASIYCWGDNFAEVITAGNQQTNYVTPTAVSGTAGFTGLGAGQGHVCAVHSGELYCWGRNAQGQIGVGSAGGNVIPIEQIESASDWVQISPGQNHTCGIRGIDLWCWGGVGSVDGEVGLGDGTQIVTSTEPALVQVQPSGGWRLAVTASRPSACALSNTGELYCWGNAEDGQLGYATWDPGDGLEHDRYRPERVGTDSDWIAVAPGGAHTCALRQGNALYCFGKDEFEQLGNGPGGPARVFEPERILLPEP